MTVRVALVGVGLVGGSIGLALRTNSDHYVISAYDQDSETAEAAVAQGVAPTVAESARTAASGADLIVIAVPVSSIVDVAAEIAPGLSHGAVVTDVGSVKAPIVSGMYDVLPHGVHFVGGHPMAGSEQAGIQAASADLFVNACWAITPTAESDPEAVRTVHRLVTALGAAPLSLDPVVHDTVVAVVSHLPQVASSSLMNVASAHAQQASVLAMAAGGFRDMTRIAGGAPHIWEDILIENAAAVRTMLDDYSAALEGFRDALDDRERLHELLESARAARRALPARTDGADRFAVVVAVADEPGTFADVMTAVGCSGINIADVELRHSPEGGGGLLTIDVIGHEAATKALDVLGERGYAVHIESVPE